MIPQEPMGLQQEPGPSQLHETLGLPSLQKCVCEIFGEIWFVGLPRKQQIAVNRFWVQESEIGEECR